MTKFYKNFIPNLNVILNLIYLLLKTHRFHGQPELDLTFQKQFLGFPNENYHKIDLKCCPP